ncbi:MAG: acyl-CoA dehydratase activase [Planctomycetota bacterium]
MKRRRMEHLFAGIDSGSWNTKAVVIDAAANVRGTSVVRSGAALKAAAQLALDVACKAADAKGADVAAAWSTGFGRHLLDREMDVVSGTRTELDCHARGVHHYIAGALTIVDIGGQDAKIIRLDDSGRRVSHRMNRKCAAGTGSFLEEIALRLGVSVDTLPRLADGWKQEVNLGAFCTVFTATEVLTLIREGTATTDLARAAYRSVVKRVLEMAEIVAPVVATGGVIAHHPMVGTLLGEALGLDVRVPVHPQEMGAFGAALAARAAHTVEAT